MKRDISLDALCGLFIIQMILQHAFQWADACDDTFYVTMGSLLYCFMPWFFFKSGMYYKENPLEDVVKHGLRRFMIPFIVYSFVGHILYCWNMYANTGDTNWAHYVVTPIKWALITGSFTGNLPLWFLLSLFLVKLMIGLADRYKVPKSIILLGSLLVAGGGTICVSNSQHVIYWVFSSSLGLFFYLSGYYLRELQYNNIWVKMLGLAVALLVIFVFPSNVDLHTDMTFKGYWIAYVIGSLGTIIVLNNIFRWRLLQMPLLTSVGKNSMDYYCAHWILFYAVLTVYDFPRNGLPDYDKFWTIIIAGIIFLPIYNYVIKVVLTSFRNEKTSFPR